MGINRNQICGLCGTMMVFHHAGGGICLECRRLEKNERFQEILKRLYQILTIEERADELEELQLPADHVPLYHPDSYKPIGYRFLDNHWHQVRIGSYVPSRREFLTHINLQLAILWANENYPGRHCTLLPWLRRFVPLSYFLPQLYTSSIRPKFSLQSFVEDAYQTAWSDIAAEKFAYQMNDLLGLDENVLRANKVGFNLRSKRVFTTYGSRIYIPSGVVFPFYYNGQVRGVGILRNNLVNDFHYIFDYDYYPTMYFPNQTTNLPIDQEPPITLEDLKGKDVVLCNTPIDVLNVLSYAHRHNDTKIRSNLRLVGVGHWVYYDHSPFPQEVNNLILLRDGGDIGNLLQVFWKVLTDCDVFLPPQGAVKLTSLAQMNSINVLQWVNEAFEKINPSPWRHANKISQKKDLTETSDMVDSLNANPTQNVLSQTSLDLDDIPLLLLQIFNSVREKLNHSSLTPYQTDVMLKQAQIKWQEIQQTQSRSEPE